MQLPAGAIHEPGTCQKAMVSEGFSTTTELVSRVKRGRKQRLGADIGGWVLHAGGTQQIT
jgi:hypothetical protein